MSPKTWHQILEEERLREASERFRKKNRGLAREWALATFLLLLIAAFVFSLFWQASGRGPLL